MLSVHRSAGVTISIVSHGQARMIAELLTDVARLQEATRVLLTYNVEEQPAPIPPALTSRIEVTHNPVPKGFAANHNAAFRRCGTEFFCVVNPDIRLPQNPFPVLLARMANATVALTAPAVMNPDGHLECTARQFPSPVDIALKVFGLYDGAVPFHAGSPPLRPDWIAGMFLLLRSEAFRQIGGFDEKFHLYYEDVDLCARLWAAGHDLLFCPDTTVVHDAQRTSHRHMKYMAWHLGSMIRYFSRHLGRVPARRRSS